MKSVLLTALLLAVITASLHALPSPDEGPASRAVAGENVKRNSNDWLGNWDEEEKDEAELQINPSFEDVEEDNVVFDNWPTTNKDSEVQGDFENWPQTNEDTEENGGFDNWPQETEEKGISPDDIVVQFFNSPGEPKVQQEELDWSDRDFLKEEYDKGLIQDSWGEDLENENPTKEDEEEDMWRMDGGVQQWSFDNDDNDNDDDDNDDNGANEEAWHMDSQSEPEAVEDPWAQQDDETVDTSDPWGDLEAQSKTDDITEINQEIDRISKKQDEIEKTLKKLEKTQATEGDVSRCKKKECAPCQVKQKCVSRDKNTGECLSEQPEGKKCCKIVYDKVCKAEAEKKAEKIGAEIDTFTKKLEELQKKLMELTKRMEELVKEPEED